MNPIERLAGQLEATASRIEREEDLEPGDLRAIEILGKSIPRARRPAVRVLVAALVLLGVFWGVFFVVSRNGTTDLDDTPFIAAVQLSPYPELTRGEPVHGEFKSGERIYLHFDLERAASVFVVLLDGRLELSPVTREVSRLPAGRQRLVFELDEESGTESLLLLAGNENWTTERALELTRSVGAGGPWPDHATALEAIVTALRAGKGIEIHALTYAHVPK